MADIRKMEAGIDPSILPVRARLVTTEARLCEVLRQHREHSGIIQLALDERVGWPDGYCQKLETLTRHATHASLWEWLQALNLAIQIVPR